MALSPDTVKAVTKVSGLNVWRVENMALVPVPPKAFGNFFEGDCYVLLNVLKSPSGATLDVHYWLGGESTQDEQGAAAILCTQLDEQLGGAAVQRREVQGSESDTFKGYFKSGVIYKKGGIASGFKHVESNTYNVKRLLHVKGKKNVTASEVELSWDSFNTSDVFLLDIGKVIVQWNGAGSNRMERLKGMKLAMDVRDRERGGRSQIGVVEGDREEESPDLVAAMAGILGPRKGPLPEGAPDDRADQHQKSNVKLYHVSDSEGSLVVQEVATRPLTQDLLMHDDCYILDQGGSKIFVWKGKGATKTEKKEAMSRALGFIKAKGYPSSTGVELVNDGAESAVFKQLFQKWSVPGQTVGLGKAYNAGKIAKVEDGKFDATLLHARPDIAAQERMVDDASGDVEVYRIENLELQPVEKKFHGQFYGGDCYLVLYTYLKANKPSHLIYMWQGRHASRDEVTASAYQAVELDRRYGGEPTQVRVTMGKEPRHFLAIFRGPVVIFEGGTSRKGGQELERATRLFQVRGTGSHNTKAIEVPACAGSLNSNDVFVLQQPNHCDVWCGKGCSGDERELGKSVAGLLTRGDKVTVLEGQEPVDFWLAIGGKAAYASDKRLQEEATDFMPRLFECSTQSGRFFVTEVAGFTQDDLDEDDVMLLDAGEELFLWLGSGASEKERVESAATAREFLKSHPSQRDPDTPVVTVKQGFEPPTFTGWFMAWDHLKWKSAKSYEDLKLELGDVTGISQITVDMNNKASVGGQSKPGGGSGKAAAATAGGGGKVAGAKASSGSKLPGVGAPGLQPQGYKSAADEKASAKIADVGGGGGGGATQNSVGGARQTTSAGAGTGAGAGGAVAAQPGHGGGHQPGGNEVDGAHSGPYPPECLVNVATEDLPPGVDPSKKEVYLGSEDFERIFEMSPSEFAGLPQWRQKELKKAKGLF
ncbi:villin-1-like [Lethenteron reissneri]|uniref:villin-1-like n=1 Tax=Lethenteron reissneri TaxID=7753 RepID=UPI002AB6E002|nr:villin-1-like [Lethenteron reissneri]XP_061432584.1 villin-1-like [Lethenteron reissneri]